jgi:stage III sporulation protein AA
MNEKLLSYFNGRLKKYLSPLDGNITEIRLRKCRPVVVYRNGQMLYLTEKGTTRFCTDECITAEQDDISDILGLICRYSVHSYQDSICNGFITLDGGHRVGICGTAVMREGKIVNVKDISGFNFRAASEVKGCGDELYNKLFSSGLFNVLIAGPPASGKTTLLRDLCRRLGERYKIAVIDERSEIAAVYNGIPQNDVGINTDVLNGFPKQLGVETAVRVMSPEMIICDEAGGDEDISAFGYAMTSGVKICASVHAESAEDVHHKFGFYDCFDYIVLLGKTPGSINEIIKVEEHDKKYLHNFSCGNMCTDRKLFCGGT